MIDSTISPSSSLLLEVAGVSQHFGGLVALDSVSMTLRSGETVGLIGPNGSGKSTLLNVISGIYRPTSGRVAFDGLDITGLPVHTIAQRGLARTFQHARVFPSLTAVQHPIVAMRNSLKAPNALNMLKSLFEPWFRWSEQAESLLREANLRSASQALAGSLPYGARRMLELARCLASEPKLLLLDEPTAGLNDAEKEEFASVLRSIQVNRSLSMIIIEHNISFITSICPRIVVLDSGRVICDAESKIALSDKKTVKAYLGTD